jgi:agmatine deiminase
MPRSRQASINADVKLRMPAEWEPHEATWIDWPGKFEPIAWAYAEIVRHLCRYERVEIIVNNADAEKSVRQVLKRAHAFGDRVRFHHWPTDRAWVRDSGCTFVKSQSPVGPDRNRGAVRSSASLTAVNWRFNAWAKYSNWRKDEKMASLMAKATRACEIEPVFRNQRVVLEGGSIEVNGHGTLLTTEECLLGKVQERNPGMKRTDYEQIFASCLGVTNVIWLKSGIAGDDTHGHVDDLARFVTADTVVSVIESDPKDVNYEPLRENIRRLRTATDQDGNELAVIELPMPRPVIFEKRRLPASYANFYVAGGIVLVPVFNDANDRVALDALADVFPDREVVGIYCGDLIWGFGAIHCMTQQQPAI